MKAARKRARRRATRQVAVEAVIAASPTLTAMHAGAAEAGYVVTGGRLYPCADGTYTARVVWRHRDDGVSITGSAQGLVLR